jgi:hypothetical protein
VTGVIAGNISDEATTRVGNIFAEAMRGERCQIKSELVQLSELSPGGTRRIVTSLNDTYF